MVVEDTVSSFASIKSEDKNDSYFSNYVTNVQLAKQAKDSGNLFLAIEFEKKGLEFLLLEKRFIGKQLVFVYSHLSHYYSDLAKNEKDTIDGLEKKIAHFEQSLIYKAKGIIIARNLPDHIRLHDKTGGVYAYSEEQYLETLRSSLATAQFNLYTLFINGSKSCEIEPKRLYLMRSLDLISSANHNFKRLRKWIGAAVTYKAMAYTSYSCARENDALENKFVLLNFSLNCALFAQENVVRARETGYGLVYFNEEKFGKSLDFIKMKISKYQSYLERLPQTF